MKSSGISRAVRGVRVDRSVGDAPTLGHVERLRDRGAGQGGGRRRRTFHDDDSRRNRSRGEHPWHRKLIMLWSVTFALVGLLVIGVVLWLWGSDQTHRSDEASAEKTATPVAEERIASRYPSPTREVALELVKRALRVRQPVDVAEFFRLGSATPEAVVAFLREMEKSDGMVTNFIWLSSIDANGLLLDGVTVVTAAEDDRHRRLALLTPNDMGKWQIDFESFARTSVPAWSDVLSASGGHGKVRVIFSKDNYYNGPFRDESLWTCYRLTSPDISTDLLGYCLKGSPQSIAMTHILTQFKRASNGGSGKRAIVEIRRPEDAAVRQFEITRVMAEDWVLSDTPFDQRQ